MAFLAASWMDGVIAGPSLAWTNNLLTFTHPNAPGGSIEIYYLEAFCLPGGHERPWGQTRVPHATRLLNRSADGSILRFQTRVGESVVVDHSVSAHPDGLVMEFNIVNNGTQRWPVQWFQPACVRVDRFTGANQSNYTARSFVFTGRGRT